MKFTCSYLIKSNQLTRSTARSLRQPRLTWIIFQIITPKMKLISLKHIQIKNNTLFWISYVLFHNYTANRSPWRNCTWQCNADVTQWQATSLFHIRNTPWAINLTSITCRWRNRMTRWITANVLQTKVDAQCDKLKTELSWQRLRRLTFSSY